MLETYTENNDSKQLETLITSTRIRLLNFPSVNNMWQDALYEWDKEFKKTLEQKYGSKHYAQQVPEWQLLVGGTPEKETDITSKQRDFILSEVHIFLKNFIENHKECF